MPKLTEEQLAKLYPAAKTYDELQAKRAELDEIRRPKFVALKIATWTALCVPLIASVFHFLKKVTVGLTSGDTIATLSSVCIGLLLAGFAAAFIYYMWWLAERVASKTILATSLMYTLLAGVLIAAIAAYFYALEHEISALIAVASITSCTFIASVGIVGYLLKRTATGKNY
jgi:hypothetical protein